MSLKLYIPIGLMLPTICGVHVSHIYMLILEICCQQFGEYVSVEYMVLDISCQHLGDECKLEGFPSRIRTLVI